MTKAIKQTNSIFISDSAELSKLIKSIGERGKKLDKDIHQAAISALAHGFEHGSTAHAETLRVALPKVSRRKALELYFIELGCFMFKEDGKTLGVNSETRAKYYNKDTKEYTEEGKARLAEIAGMPFWEYTKEVTPPSPVEAMELVRNLIKRLQKAKGEGLLDDSSVLDKLMQVAPAVITTEEAQPEPAKA